MSGRTSGFVLAAMTIDVATRFGVYDMAGCSDIRDLGHLDGRSFIEVYSDHYEGGLTDQSIWNRSVVLSRGSVMLR